MHGHQHVHATHTPPEFPSFRCAGCRVGMALEHIRKVSAGCYYRRTRSIPDRLPSPRRVSFEDLTLDDLQQCARCNSRELTLVEDPYFGPAAEVCRACYAEYGDPTEPYEVTTNLSRD